MLIFWHLKGYDIMADSNMAEDTIDDGKAQETFDSLNGTQKCAILMLLIGEEEAANILTNPALDPVAKIPELKYAAAQLTKIVS